MTDADKYTAKEIAEKLNNYTAVTIPVRFLEGGRKRRHAVADDGEVFRMRRLCHCVSIKRHCLCGAGGSRFIEPSLLLSVKGIL